MTAATTPAVHGNGGSAVAAPSRPGSGSSGVPAVTVTEITQFRTKADMSSWTRAHGDAAGITWSVFPGPGGTMIVVEHEQDRRDLPVPVFVLSGIQNSDEVRFWRR
jgi:hypothetical protein